MMPTACTGPTGIRGRVAGHAHERRRSASGVPTAENGLRRGSYSGATRHAAARRDPIARAMPVRSAARAACVRRTERARQARGNLLVRRQVQLHCQGARSVRNAADTAVPTPSRSPKAQKPRAASPRCRAIGSRYRASRHPTRGAPGAATIARSTTSTAHPPAIRLAARRNQSARYDGMNTR
jgi:hypothetical protein